MHETTLWSTANFLNGTHYAILSSIAVLAVKPHFPDIRYDHMIYGYREPDLFIS